MKGVWRALAGLALVLAILAGVTGVAAAAELRVLAWADYLAPDLLAKFERETGITVTVDTYVSVGGMLDALRTRPGTYDIALPADYHVPALSREGLLERIDAARLPGYANILDGWRSPPYDRRNEYSVPFHWGTTSIVVDTAVYSGTDYSLRLLFDPPPELADRVGFLWGAEETLRMALQWLGLPQCTSNREYLRRAIDHIRPRLHSKRLYTISSAIDTLASGRVAVGIAWNGDALRAREKRPSLRYLYPEEGLILWSDTLVVPKGAPHREAALRFINFTLQPENAAIQTNFTRYANTVRGSDIYLDPALLDAPEVIIPSDVKIRFFRFCDADQLTLYAEMWDALLTVMPVPADD